MILRGQLKRLSILLMILFISCFMLVINSTFFQSDTPVQVVSPSKTPNSNNDIQQSAENIFLVQYDQDGNKKTEITAKLFTQYTSGLQSFTDPNLFLYKTAKENTNNSNTLNWEISAKQAQINNSNILLLEEDVTGTRWNEGLFKFTTDWLNFDLDKNIVSSDAQILIWQAQNTGSATGFDMNLNTNKIDIQLHNNVVFQFLDEDK